MNIIERNNTQLMTQFEIANYLQVDVNIVHNVMHTLSSKSLIRAEVVGTFISNDIDQVTYKPVKKNELATDKHGSLVTVTKIDDSKHAALVPDWQRLEQKERSGGFDITNMSKKDILLMALEAEEERERLSLKVEADRYKVEFVEHLEASSDLMTITSVGAQLGLTKKESNDLITKLGWLENRKTAVWGLNTKKNATFPAHVQIPRDSTINNGYMVMAMCKDETARFESYPMVTGKGMIEMRAKLHLVK